MINSVRSVSIIVSTIPITIPTTITSCHTTKYYSLPLQDMLTGNHCCFDIRGGLLGWSGGDPDWGKKCCDNKVAPVKQPPDNISQDQLDRVS